MIISCLPATEAQVHQITEQLKRAGLYSRYEETVRGESILISVQTGTFEEREIVKTILRKAGITELFYGTEIAA
jgi:hypothetical protein